MSKDYEFDLKTYLDEKFKENKESHDAIQTRVDKTNGRVRSLEKFRYAIAGALAVISVVISLMPTIMKAMSQ